MPRWQDTHASSHEPGGLDPISELEDLTLSGTTLTIEDGVVVTVNEPLRWGTGAAFGATLYQIGRDADGTNQLHLNVPTGASLEYSVNDVAVIVASATLLDLKDGLVIEANEPIKWDSGAAITATNYEIGRNADGTNLLQLNVPTGASFELSINDVAQLSLSATALTLVPTTLALGAAPSITTASGSLTFSAFNSTVNFNNGNMTGVNQIFGRATANLILTPNTAVSNTQANRLILQTLDTTGDAFIQVAYAVPTGTETTPFWAQRANGTVPVVGSLDASFLTFRWNQADDVVTVYVNDGGTIRSVAIGTVV
jgi:hypothetical protein